MKKILFDVGANIGQSILKFLRDGVIDESWEIFCFEPNPTAFKILKSRLDEKKIKAVLNSSAAWNEDCNKNMTIELVPNEFWCPIENKCIASNSDIGLHSNIMGSDFETPDYFKGYEHLLKRDNIQVQCIDFSQFFKSKVNSGDIVILKLDCEGAEYQILNKMIQDDTLKMVNELYVEFHLRFLTEEARNTKIYNHNELYQKIKDHGIIPKGWE
jgi:FkbM family methyltransferase